MNNKIIDDYHGDIKLIKNNSKKVDLSKPTDILDHKSKQQELMPTIYSNRNLTKKINHSNDKVCLTKQKDIISENEDFNPFNNQEQHYQESLKFQFKSKVPIKQLIMKFSPVLILTLMSLLSGDDLFHTIALVGIYLMLFSLVKIKKQ